MRFNLRHATAVATAITLMSPVIASAQSVSDIQTQIQGLMNQIKTLQQQLLALRASSTPPVMPQWKDTNASSTNPLPPKTKWCVGIARNIRVGDRGDDIRQLQDMLREDGRFGFLASSTGFFGPMTAQAMAKWQMMHGIASSTDGSIGPKTRAFFQNCTGDNASNIPGPSILRDLGDKLRAFFGVGDENRRDVVAGKVATVSSQSFTVVRPNGVTHTVMVTASTTIKVMFASSSSPVMGGMADIVVGKLIKADGTANNDGSLKAHMVLVGISTNEQWGWDTPPTPPVPSSTSTNSGN